MAKVTPERVDKLAQRTGRSKKDCRDLLQAAGGDMGMARYMAGLLRYHDASERVGPAVKPKRLKDPVFGNLNWKHQWTGKSAPRPAGNKRAVTVESTGGAPPDERQREAYRAFLKHERALSRPLKEANFRYYRKTRKRWARTEDPDFLEEIAPDVKSANDVAAMLSHASVHVPRQPRRGWQVHLRWQCAWDEEHGHEARIRDGEIKRIGRIGG
jgi:hypothetical protein